MTTGSSEGRSVCGCAVGIAECIGRGVGSSCAQCDAVLRARWCSLGVSVADRVIARRSQRGRDMVVSGGATMTHLWRGVATGMRTRTQCNCRSRLDWLSDCAFWRRTQGHSRGGSQVRRRRL